MRDDIDIAVKTHSASQGVTRISDYIWFAENARTDEESHCSRRVVDLTARFEQFHSLLSGIYR